MPGRMRNSYRVVTALAFMIVELLGLDAVSPARADEFVPRCLSDFSSGAGLEIQYAEVSKPRSTPSPRYSGSWQHLKLSELPAWQAEYLKRHGGFLPTAEDLDVRDCSELICVLEKIYGSRDAALHQAVLYLKGGYMLSSARKVPFYNPVTRDGKQTQEPAYGFGDSFRDHLFPLSDIENFWVTAQILPDVFRNHPDISRIFRIPYEKAPPNTPTAYAAIGRNAVVYNSEICLGKGCGRLDYSTIISNRPFQHFEVLLGIALHELAHFFDFGHAKKGASRISERAEWKSFSGWKKLTTSSKDPVTSANRIEETWIHETAPEYEPPISEYARKMGPIEDFADTVVAVRGGLLHDLEKAPRKVAYVSKLVFNERRFDPVSLAKNYAERIAAAVSVELPAAIASCLKDSAPGGMAAGFSFSRLGLSEPVSRCVSKLIEPVLEVERRKIRLTELEGCAILDGQRLHKYDRDRSKIQNPPLEIFDARLEDRILDEASRLVEFAASTPEMLPKLTQARRVVSEQLDAAGALLDCASESSDNDNWSDCYSEKISTRIGALNLDRDPRFGLILAREAKTYLRTYPFDQILAELESTLVGDRALTEAPARRWARERWNSCLSLSKDSRDEKREELPPTRPYSGGTQFVSASLLRCVNERFDQELANIELNSTTPRERPILSNIFRRAALSELSTLTASAASDERMRREAWEAATVQKPPLSLGRLIAHFDEMSTKRIPGSICDSAIIYWVNAEEAPKWDFVDDQSWSRSYAQKRCSNSSKTVSSVLENLSEFRSKAAPLLEAAWENCSEPVTAQEREPSESYNSYVQASMADLGLAWEFRACVTRNAHRVLDELMMQEGHDVLWSYWAGKLVWDPIRYRFIEFIEDRKKSEGEILKKWAITAIREQFNSGKLVFSGSTPQSIRDECPRRLEKYLLEEAPITRVLEIEDWKEEFIGTHCQEIEKLLIGTEKTP